MNKKTINQTVTADPVINEKNLYQAFRCMKQKDLDGAQELLKEGLASAQNNQDHTLEGLYYSALGILYKLKNNYKKAYKYYQHAEQLLPDDLSLKLITSVLLVEQFHQYETAFRKLEKILSSGTSDPAIIHHVMVTQALALFHMSKKEQAKNKLQEILNQDFNDLRFVANIDFKMIDLFTKKTFELDLCQTYLDKALALAKKTKDKTYEIVIEELISRLKLHQAAHNK